MTTEKKYTKKEMEDFIQKMIDDGVLNTKGKWINNEAPIWRHVVNPCKLCGYCPYGQLVEEYPLPPLTRKYMVDHNEYMRKALAEGVFDEENKVDGLPLMTREEAQKYIDEFDPEDYPEEKDEQMEKMSCSVFGHCCPVFYQMELFAEDEEATDEEMVACDKEICERCKKMMKEE